MVLGEKQSRQKWSQASRNPEERETLGAQRMIWSPVSLLFMGQPKLGLRQRDEGEAWKALIHAGTVGESFTKHKAMRRSCVLCHLL